MGNRAAVTKTAEDGTVAEWEKYEYNESNQLIAEELYNGKKTTKLAYAYDEDGNLISETGKIGTEKVQKSYECDVENRLAAVYDGKEKNYELIEYINDVNREYTEVLVEQNINGKLDTAYVYGNDRLSLDRFDGSRGYYLYDPKGNVTGITNEEGQVYQSYRYGSFGEITFGAPQYENEYTYNGESYNPNIESQYLRARYYNVVHADFLTEDSYLGNIYEPLTLNRYNYCVSNPVNYRDPSGNDPINAPWAGMDILYWLTGDETYREQADEMRATQQELEYYEGSTAAGILVGMYEPVQNDVSQIMNPILSLLPGYVKPVSEDTTYIDEKVCQVYDRNDYYVGKCAGNVMIQVAGTITAIGAAKKAYSGLKLMIKGASGNGWELATVNGVVIKASELDAAASEAALVGTAGTIGIASILDTMFHVNLIKANGSKVDWDGMVNGSETSYGKSSGNSSTSVVYSKINQSQITSQNELSIQYFDTLSNNGLISGGRSGNKIPLRAQANSYFRTTQGHVVIYGNNGMRIMDISAERIKIEKYNVNPNNPNVGSWSAYKIKNEFGQVEQTEQWILNYFGI